MSPCWFFLRGMCRYGNHCCNDHSSSPTSISDSGPDGDSGPSTPRALSRRTSSVTSTEIIVDEKDKHKVTVINSGSHGLTSTDGLLKEKISDLQPNILLLEAEVDPDRKEAKEMILKQDLETMRDNNDHLRVDLETMHTTYQRTQQELGNIKQEYERLLSTHDILSQEYQSLLADTTQFMQGWKAFSAGIETLRKAHDVTDMLRTLRKRSVGRGDASSTESMQLATNSNGPEPRNSSSEQRSPESAAVDTVIKPEADTHLPTTTPREPISIACAASSRHITINEQQANIGRRVSLLPVFGRPEFDIATPSPFRLSEHPEKISGLSPASKSSTWSAPHASSFGVQSTSKTSFTAFTPWKLPNHGDVCSKSTTRGSHLDSEIGKLIADAAGQNPKAVPSLLPSDSQNGKKRRLEVEEEMPEQNGGERMQPDGLAPECTSKRPRIEDENLLTHKSEKAPVFHTPR